MFDAVVKRAFGAHKVGTRLRALEAEAALADVKTRSMVTRVFADEARPAAAVVVAVDVPAPVAERQVEPPAEHPAA